MKVYGRKNYEVLSAGSPTLVGKQFEVVDKQKFLIDTDLYQGDILKVNLPAGSIIKSINQDFSHVEEIFAEAGDVYIAIDEGLDSIYIPEGAKVSIVRFGVVAEGDSSGGNSGGGSVELQDKTFTENGTYTADEGFDGLGVVVVDVGGNSGGGGEGEVDPLVTSFMGIIDDTTPITVLPDGLTRISDNTFYDCRNLALTSLPDSVNIIGNGAFQNCKNLALPSLPDKLTAIGKTAFRGCTNLALTYLPDGLISINNNAFQDCTSLALTYLPDGLTSIGSNCFHNCPKLALTSLPSGVKTIYSLAFGYCTGLTEITFNGTPTTIGADVFTGCTNLTTINVPWAEGAVANAPWGATNATIQYNYTGE